MEVNKKKLGASDTKDKFTYAKILLILNESKTVSKTILFLK